MRRLLDLAVAKNLIPERNVAIMMENVKSGKFTARYYIKMWVERLGKESADVQSISDEVRPHLTSKGCSHCGTRESESLLYHSGSKIKLAWSVHNYIRSILGRCR